MREIEEMDRAVAELTAEVEETHRKLLAAFQEKMGILKEMRAELAREVPVALEAVEETLAHSQPALHTDYAALFRHLADCPRPFRLFSYTLHPSPLPTLAFQCQLASPQALYPSQFTYIFKDTLNVYNIVTEEVSKAQISMDFDGCSFVETQRGSIMCVGGRQTGAGVWGVDLVSLQITALQALATPREHPGLIKYGEWVYLFGGLSASKTLTACDKYSLSESKWKGLGPMQYPRGFFVPCLCRDFVYLVSCWSKKHRAIETFKPETENYRVLAVALPAHLDLCMGSVAFEAKGELCLLTENMQLARWKVDAERAWRLFHLEKQCYSTQQALVVGSKVFIAFDWELMKFSLETYNFL